MKRILSKVMTLVLLGSALTFASCNKDYENDLNQLRDDMTDQLEDQNQALLDAIETAKQEAIAYADAAEKAAKDYADKIAASEAAAAKAEAIAEAKDYTDDQVAAALDEAIAAAKTFADEALEAANKYADNAAKAAYEKAHNEMLEHVQKECEKTLTEAKIYAKNYTDGEIEKLETRMKKLVEQVQKTLQDQIDQNKTDILANAGSITTLNGLVEGLREDLDEITRRFNTFKEQAEQTQRNNESRFGLIEDRLKGIEDRLKKAEGDISDNADAIEDHETAINNINGEIEGIHSDITTINGQISTINGQISTINGQIEGIQGDITVINGQISGINVQISDINDKIEGIDTEIEGIHGDITTINNKINVIDSQIDSLKEDIKANADAIDALEADRDRHDQELQALRDRATALEADRDRHDQELQALRGRADALEADRDRHDQELQALRDRATALEADRDRHDQELQALRDRATTLERQILEHKDAIEALQNGLSDLNGKHEILAGRVTTCENNIATLFTSLKNLSDRLDREVENIKNIINEKVGALEDMIDEVEKKLNEKIGELAEKHHQDSITIRNLINSEIADRMAADQAEALKRAEEDDAIRADIENLKIKLQEELAIKFRAIENEFAKVRTELAEAIENLKKDLTKYIDKGIDNLDKKQSARMTSITLIPEYNLGGIPAIEVPAISFAQINIGRDESYTKSNVKESAYNTVNVRYHVSPAHVTRDGIKSVDYLMETIQTKAKTTDDVTKITDFRVNESTNELIVDFVKKTDSSHELNTEAGYDNGNGNRQRQAIALRAEIADNLKATGEDEAYVTSEYSIVYTKLHDMKMFINNTRWNSYSQQYNDALNNLANVNAHNFSYDYNKVIDLRQLVKVGVSEKGLGSWHEMSASRMDELGYKITFAKPANEQYYTLNGSKMSSSGKNAIGKPATVRAMLSIDGYIVDVCWIVIRWGLDDQNLGIVYDDFNYQLSCIGMTNKLTEAQFQTNVLDKVREKGIAKERYVELYKEAITANPGAAEFKNNTFTWTVDYSDVPSDAAERLLRKQPVQLTGVFTAQPKDFCQSYIGTIDFKMIVNIILPADMPQVDKNNFKEISWQVNTELGSLARVAPVAFIQANYHPGDEVQFDYDIKSLFKNDPIVKNVIWASSNTAKACRAWDIVFSKTQRDSVSAGTHSLNAKYNRGNVNVANIEFTFNPAASTSTWFNANAQSIKLKIKNETSTYQILNDFDKMDKRINLEILARINENSEFVAHKFQMYVVNPLNIPYPALKSTTFKDDRYHKSAIDVRTAFDGIQDFRLVKVVAYEEDATSMEMDRRNYYGLQDPIWDVNVQRWTSNAESNVLPNSSNSTLASQYKIEYVNRELTYHNLTSNYLTEPIAVWIPVIVKHSFEVKTQWVKFIIEPVKE